MKVYLTYRIVEWNTHFKEWVTLFKFKEGETEKLKEKYSLYVKNNPQRTFAITTTTSIENFVDINDL